MNTSANSQVRHLITGDINVGSGQLGETITFVPSADVNMEPGLDFTKFYSHYIVNLDTMQTFINFTLGTTSTLGHSYDIFVTGADLNKYVNVLLPDTTLLVRLYVGFGAKFIDGNVKTFSLFLPPGLFNRLIIYDVDGFPRIDVLAVQNEFNINGNFEYGINCLVSYDSTEPTLLTDLVNYDNLHRVIICGCNLYSYEILAQTPPFDKNLQTFNAACGLGSLMQVSDLVKINYSAIGSTTLSTEQCYDLTSVALFAYNGTGIDQSLAGPIVGFCNLGLQNQYISGNNTPTTYTTNIGGISDGAFANTQGTTSISCFTDRIIGNGDDSLVGGFNNSIGGHTFLSSSIAVYVNTIPGDQYRVRGGNLALNWDINSQNGEFIGSAFTVAGPIPGFAEYYENLTSEKLEYGRLLTLEIGKVRYSKSGEYSNFVSKPADVGGFNAGISGSNDKCTLCEKHGKVVVLHDGSLLVGNYAKSSKVGIATHSSQRTNIEVLKLINEKFALVLITPVLYNIESELQLNLVGVNLYASNRNINSDVVAIELPNSDSVNELDNVYIKQNNLESYVSYMFHNKNNLLVIEDDILGKKLFISTTADLTNCRIREL